MTERILRIPAHRLGEFEEPAGIERHYNFTRWERHIIEGVLVSRRAQWRLAKASGG